MRGALPSRYRGHPAPVLSKWFARSFLFARGCFPDDATATREMSQVAAEAERQAPEPWDWASFEEVRDAVRAAGGIVLLAHPAGYRRGNLAAQLALIGELMAAGLDGFELYHPSNAREPHFEALVAEARRLGCAVSGGSDTHLDPGTDGRAAPGAPAPEWAVASIDEALARRGR